MPTQLTTVNLVAPGFQGVNLEDPPIAQSPAYADVADNCIIDQSGRVASRKGVEMLTAATPSSAITAIGEYRPFSGNTQILSTNATQVFKDTNTLVDITPGGYTINNSDWKIVNFNNKAYLFAGGQEPLVYDGTTMQTYTAAGGTDALGAANPIGLANEGTAAFGRMWISAIPTEPNIIYWSNLLDPLDYSTGSAGSIDLTQVWPNGYDEVVAVAEHNNYLLIFGKDSIVVYGGAENPATMSLVDAFDGVGCVDRNTIQSIGSDLLFLSQTGLRSMGRVIQEKSLPISDRSRNIKNQMRSYIKDENTRYISVYSPEEQFYLLGFIGLSVTLCFDLRAEIENGAYRVTRWPACPHTAYYRDDSGELYIGTEDGIGTHKGYLDNTDTYTLRYESPSLDFGDSSKLKMLKAIKPTFIGGNGNNVSLYWAFDFQALTNAQAYLLDGQNPDYYGVGEYNIAEYTGGPVVTRDRINASGSGTVIKISVETIINDQFFSIQEINVFATLGKVL